MWIGRWHWILEALVESVGFRARKLRRGDDAAAVFARSQGVRGAYVVNALAAGEADGLVFERDGSVAAIAWFGPRGNLVVVCSNRSRGYEADVVRRVLASRYSWRIALGDAAVIDGIRARVGRSVLAHRDQVYYVGGRDDAGALGAQADVRKPVGADRERLARATLALNASDLNIAPDRVDRRWLYRTIDDRCREGATMVLGPPGELWCKLDLGSQGPAGDVLEGVYTFPEHRGRGYATSLVAGAMAANVTPASLHVAAHNAPARRAYEAAGMREAGTCRLLLLG